jgi:hypothetical protein
MLAAMNALRLSAAAIVVLAVSAAAAALGSCSSGPEITVSICAIPTLDEKGADGSPDPCHCNPPPSLNITTCPCLSGDPQSVDSYNACMTLYRGETDAGAEGGPISGCTGECWPIPPPDWAPLLLWVGLQSNAPPCPEVAPAPVYGGYATGTFALACTSNASGTCPGLGDVCGPEAGDGFWTCIFREGDVDCPLVGPYDEKHVFYETAGSPTLPSTFCCPSAPLPLP